MRLTPRKTGASNAAIQAALRPISRRNPAVTRRRRLRPVAFAVAATLVWGTPLRPARSQDAGQTPPPMAPADASTPTPPSQDPTQQDDTTLPALPSQPTTPQEAEKMMDDLYPNEGADAPPLVDTTNERRNWRFIPSLATGLLYDDNIFISHTDRKSDFLTTVTGRVQLGIGDFEVKENNFATLDYAGVGLLFARNTSQDAYDQDAAASAQADLGPVTLNAAFHFQSLSDTDIDTGGRTKRQLYDTTLTAQYKLDDKFYFEAEGDSNIAQYSTFLNSTAWLGRLSLNYKMSPKAVIGAGAGAGVLQVSDSPDQTYEQVFARATYAESDKVTLDGEIGLEYRQAPGLDKLTPIFNLKVTYQPEEATSISLTTYRRVTNSALTLGDDYTSTGVSLDCRRQVFGNGEISIAAGFERDAYDSFANSGSTGRKDNYYYVRPAISWSFIRNCKVEIFFKSSHDASSRSNFSFRDNQVGIEATFSY